MRRITSILTLIAVSILFVSACSPGQPSTSIPTVPAVDGQKIVTLDDQGKTISLTVGESFLLKLGDRYTWIVTISDQNVVSRVKNIAVVRGAQGVYNATQSGTVTLSAAGDPQCRQSQPSCAMPSIQFMITIVVK